MSKNIKVYTARPPPIFRNIKGVFYMKSVHNPEIKFNWIPKIYIYIYREFLVL